MKKTNYEQITFDPLTLNVGNTGKLQDFGEKIGGARKDLRIQNLSDLDMEDFTLRELEKYVRKANIWKAPDYAAIVDSGVPTSVAYYRKIVRDAAPATPKILNRHLMSKDQVRRMYQLYTDTLSDLRDRVNRLRSVADCLYMWQAFLYGNGFWEPGSLFGRTQKWRSDPVMTEKLEQNLLVLSEHLFCSLYETEAELKGFPSRKKKATTKRSSSNSSDNKKSKFIPKQLQHIRRDGPEYRSGDVTGLDYLNDFKFRGGEFGNWMTDIDRQESLNMCFDALKDLATVLGISDASISYNGELAIAFGSRGRGNAVAHYEPLRKVINLTKMRGAGSLAHEWWHGLDDYIGDTLGLTRYASESRSVYPPMDHLLEACKVMSTEPEHPNYMKRTKFYMDSQELGSAFQKSGHGYWDSDVELTARAFACYVKDRLGFQSDYLVGHAESAYYGNLVGYPIGEERRQIDYAFDELFEDLKERGILEAR